MRRLLLAVGVGVSLVIIGAAVAASINGTMGNDSIRGTARADVLNGRGGSDTIFGLAGNDWINGGPGDDRISGGPGSDRISGGGGKDIVSCGAGIDRVQADVLDVVAKDCEIVTRPPFPAAPTPTPAPLPTPAPTPTPIPAPMPSPKYDVVTGSGQRADISVAFPSETGFTPTFTVDARSGPSGENGQGTMTIDWGTSWLDAPYFGAPYSTTIKVTNLCVTGNTATIVGYITSGTPNATIGDPLVTMLQDGSEGGKSDGMLGVYSGSELGGRDLGDVCRNPYPPEPNIPFLPLTSGNITVTDAAP